MYPRPGLPASADAAPFNQPEYCSCAYDPMIQIQQNMTEWTLQKY